MKKKMQGTLLIMALSAASIAVSAGQAFYDKAKVLRVTPIYETVEVARPEKRCWNERVEHRRSRQIDSYTPSIAGAIVGGVVGNQFGKGRGKDAMTVAGALLGASVGHDLARHPGPRTYVTTERRCKVVDRYQEKQVLSGYRVKYRYRGNVYTTRTTTDPGKHLRVRVEVQPAEEYAYTDDYSLD